MSDNSTSVAEKCPLVPFLKWPGGKRWISPLLSIVLGKELVRQYREPFLGAGAVFLQLRPSSAYLSDSNRELVHFLNVAKVWPEEVVRHVWRWTNTRACYERVRSSRPRTDIGKAARFLYLNRTCWGGVYRTNRHGKFNVPFGDSGRGLCSLAHVISVSEAFSQAVIEVRDFEDSIDETSAGDVVYADPPYTAKGEDNGFLRYNETIFQWTDQMRLAASLRRAKRRGVFVTCSGLHHPELFRLYPGWWAVTVPRHSTVSRLSASRRSVREVLILSRKPKALPGDMEVKLQRIASS